eukprot:5298409-Heterocapsa_arctica.AAC.1
MTNGERETNNKRGVEDEDTNEAKAKQARTKQTDAERKDEASKQVEQKRLFLQELRNKKHK